MTGNHQHVQRSTVSARKRDDRVQRDERMRDAADADLEPVPGNRRSPTHDELSDGYPALAAVPELHEVLTALLEADRAILLAVDQLVELRSSGLCETATGVGVDGWLTIVARRTGTDRRMLTTCAAVLRRLPAVRDAVRQHRVSWAQLRAVVLKVHRFPADHDPGLDTAIAGAIADHEDHDPDQLPTTVEWILDDLRADRPHRTDLPPARDLLILQPRLDGSGGRFYGELTPTAFAALDHATHPGPSTRLATHDDEEDPTAGPTSGRPRWTTPGERRAHALADLCLHATALRDHACGVDASGATAPSAADTRGSEPVDPTFAGRLAGGSSDAHLLLRVELETLLGDDARPAQLLTTLSGGAMQVDAATAGRLAERAGSLRLIVTDRGRPVGVGRRRRSAPGWLRESILALHDTCSHPGCREAASTAHLDHAHPWASGGATDVGNLAPLCPHHNRTKERRGWRARQRADGSRRWHHPRSGLTVTTHPDRPSRRPRRDGRPPPPEPPAPSSGAGPPDG